MSQPHARRAGPAFPSQAYRNFLHESVEVPAVTRLLSVPTGGRVLEVGCGRGVAMRPLSLRMRPELLVGLDLAHVALDIAASRARRRRVDVSLCNADATEMPFADECFDVVVDFGTCYHLPQPEAALREIERVLARGGVFVHETALSQLLAHPVRTSGRRLPWSAAPRLVPHRAALLWATRRRE